VRVAVVGLAGGSAGRTAKELLRLVLADPLKAEEEWERGLDKYDARRPLVVRVGKGERVPSPQQQRHLLEPAGENLVPEVYVSSPTLGGHNIEILLMEGGPFGASEDGAAPGDSEDALLVPTVEIPSSDTGRFTPLATPVHKTLVIVDGIQGALSLGAVFPPPNPDEVATLVNVTRPDNDDGASSRPSTTVDVDLGARAVAAFRQGPEHAMRYEKLWSRSHLSDALTWLRTGALTTADSRTKPAVRRLIGSVLRGATARIRAEEARRLAGSPHAHAAGPRHAALDGALTAWAAAAHGELRERLDAAFSSRRWRKLGWWKLFWRVDDVSMLASELVTLRFLPLAEKQVIYLAGRIREAGGPQGGEEVGYAAPLVARPQTDKPAAQGDLTPWPTHIPLAREYLLEQLTPALQTAAQNLVLTTLSTSAVSAALAALMYLSSFGAYEAGAVGVLGLVWSLRGMQKKWEDARDVWEAEAHEEGRKAIRATAKSVADALDRSLGGSPRPEEAADDLSRARRLVEEAEEVLPRLR